MTYEAVIALVTEQQAGEGGEAGTRTAPRKSLQRPSVVAQIWRKPSLSEVSDKTPRCPLSTFLYPSSYRYPKLHPSHGCLSL
jgi:hypothetical protein